MSACDPQTEGRGVPAKIPVSEGEYAPSYKEICNTELQMAFVVKLAADRFQTEWLRSMFTPARTCAGNRSSALQALTAGGRATFSVSRLSVERDGVIALPLPAVTTRVVVRFSDQGRRPVTDSELLTQEFVNTYTFAEPVVEQNRRLGRAETNRTSRCVCYSRPAAGRPLASGSIAPQFRKSSDVPVSPSGYRHPIKVRA